MKLVNVLMFVSCFLFYRNVSLDIKMKLEKTAIYNVIGTITGGVEPGKTIEYHVFSFQ